MLMIPPQNISFLGRFQKHMPTEQDPEEQMLQNFNLCIVKKHLKNFVKEFGLPLMEVNAKDGRSLVLTPSEERIRFLGEATAITATKLEIIYQMVKEIRQKGSWLSPTYHAIFGSLWAPVEWAILSSDIQVFVQLSPM